MNLNQWKLLGCGGKVGEELEDPKFSPMDPEEDRQDVNMIWMLETALILKKNSKLQDSEDIWIKFPGKLLWKSVRLWGSNFQFFFL